MFILRVTTLLLFLCALWMPSLLAQDAPDYKPLVGVWSWRPISTWAAQLTIKEVSDTGLVTAEWKDANSTIPFTTQARVVDGNIRVPFGGTVKYDLEYSKSNDSLSGSATGWPPRFTGSEWHRPHFRRTK